jgi:putative membrane protein
MEGYTMKATHLATFISALSAWFFWGCRQRTMGHSMEGWHPMIGYGGLFMWLILIIVAGALVYYLFMRSKNSGGSKAPSKESPAEILKRRYAAGEITKEEF